jgi:phosphate/sulfate permease
LGKQFRFFAHALSQRFLRILRHPRAVPVLAVIATAVWAADLVVEFWIIAAVLAGMFAFAFALAVHAIFVARTEFARRRGRCLTACRNRWTCHRKMPGVSSQISACRHAVEASFGR